MAFLAALMVFLIVLLLGLSAGKGRTRLGFAAPAAEQPAARTSPSTIALERWIQRLGIRVTAQQFLAFAGLGVLALVLMVYRLIGSIPIALVIGGAVVAFGKSKLNEYEEKRRQNLTVQFKEALTAITFSLRAGASLQTAIEQALKDLQRLYPAGKSEPIVEEFTMLVQQIRLGVPVETALTEWEQAMGIESISDFVAGTLAVKARGGNLAEVMTTISETISWKIVAQAQIRAITAEKRSDANLLTAVPVLVLIALTVFSPAYIAPLFETKAGQNILLIGVILNVLAFFATRKVLETEL